MAQPRITSKVLMEKNVSFGLKSIIEETEKHQNGISEDNTKSQPRQGSRCTSRHLPTPQYSYRGSG